MAAPELTEPPLAKVQSIVPVFASKAYMVPIASRAPAKTTPLAQLTGPGVMAIASDGVVAVGIAGGWFPATCQRTCPVVASSAVQKPPLTVLPACGPTEKVTGAKAVLATARNTCWSLTAEPHSRPPNVPPGPACVDHTTSPVSGSSAQYIPLFWPSPSS